MAKASFKQNSKWILIAAVLFLAFSGVIFYFTSNISSPTPVSNVPPEEQKKIDQWIRENDLNEYGDPKTTVYAGGTPLYNEVTGEYTQRYEYILQQHPDRPWGK